MPIIISLLLTLMMSITAWANAGPPSMSPGDQQLVFIEETGVALTEEWIRLEISDEYFSRGRVDVTYHLENTSGEERYIDLLFITPRFPDHYEDADFTATAGGVEIREFTEVSGRDLPGNWQADIRDFNIDPVGNRKLAYFYEDHGRYGRDQQMGYGFEVFLNETGTTELQVSYNSYSGYYDFQQVINVINTQIYYLSPAAFWEGDVTVHYEVVLPSDDFEIYSNLPLVNAGEGRYMGSLDGLPDAEWMINYVSTSGLYFGTNNPLVHNGMAAALMLLLLIIGLLTLKSNRLISRIVMIFILPIILLFHIPYGFEYLFVYLWPVILLIGLVVAIFTYRRRFKKQRSI